MPGRAAGARPVRKNPARAPAPAPGGGQYSFCQGQWQAQIQAQIQLKADVFVHSELSDGQIRDALLIPCPQIEATAADLMKKYGPKARICVMPESPQTIPFVDVELS
jgi:hypothetical protein